MPYLLGEFLEKYPATDLIMDVTNRSTVVDHLIDNSVDFALVSVVPSKPELNKLTLFENELVLVGNEVYAQRARKNLDNCRFCSVKPVLQRAMLWKSLSPSKTSKQTAFWN